MQIVGHRATVVNGTDSVRLARWQRSLEKATTPERAAAVQREIDKILGLGDGLTKEQRAAALRAELARLEG